MNIAQLIQETAQSGVLCYAPNRKEGKTMGIKENAKKRIEKAVANVARKSASVEANTTCSCWGYQSKEPEQVKALRKF